VYWIFVSLTQTTFDSRGKQRSDDSKMKNHQNINSDSGNDEYFTPLEIVESARNVLGGIDLDPASSLIANQRIGATRIFTLAEDGLSQPWAGRVWMNHPFGKGSNKRWISKLCAEYASGRVAAAVCISFASTSEQWFRPLLNLPQCFLWRRTNYFLPDSSLKRGVTKGSVVTYFGLSVERFAQEFSKLGTVKIQCGASKETCQL
jgi:hypothetical protein